VPYANEVQYRVLKPRHRCTSVIKLCLARALKSQALRSVSSAHRIYPSLPLFLETSLYESRSLAPKLVYEGANLSRMVSCKTEACLKSCSEACYDCFDSSWFRRAFKLMNVFQSLKVLLPIRSGKLVDVFIFWPEVVRGSMFYSHCCVWYGVVALVSSA
jgi:hypothetical protein